MLFVSRFPALVNSEGHPKTWRHFTVGMGHISRDRSRSILDHFKAMMATEYSKEDREEWVKTQSIHAGWE